MKKFMCFMDFNKEEKWLNEMARKGYALCNASFGYDFYRIEPENSTIRIDYRTFKSQKDFIDYCTLFEDSGWRHIAGTKYSGAQYFKKIREDSEDDIFSDAVSRAGRYKRMSSMWLTMVICYMPLTITLLLQGNLNLDAIANPKMLYYTPGLWEMTGRRFWTHFLFETPFALGRGFSWLVFLLLLILYICFAIKANILYNKSIKS